MKIIETVKKNPESLGIVNIIETKKSVEIKKFEE